MKRRLTNRDTLFQDEQRANAFDPPFVWRRFYEWIGAVFLFFLISAYALSLAFGYKINFEQKSLVQYGALEIFALNGQIDALVTVNGELIGSELPLRRTKILPGELTISITAEGYLPWTHQVMLAENGRVRLDPIVLLSETRPVLADDVTLTDSRFVSKPDSQIRVKKNNELWLGDTFLTRYSEDIYGEEWLEKDKVIIFKKNTTFALYNIELNKTTELFDASTLNGEAVPSDLFFLTENNSVLFFAAGSDIYRYRLFVPNRVILLPR